MLRFTKLNPKPSLAGFSVRVPPRSDQARRSRPAPEALTMRQPTLIDPPGPYRAPYFAAFVDSSWNTIAKTNAGRDGRNTAPPENAGGSLPS